MFSLLYYSFRDHLVIWKAIKKKIIKKKEYWSLPEFLDGHVLLGILLHDFSNGHLKVFLCYVNTALTKCVHTSFGANALLNSKTKYKLENAECLWTMERDKETGDVPPDTWKGLAQLCDRRRNSREHEKRRNKPWLPLRKRRAWARRSCANWCLASGSFFSSESSKCPNGPLRLEVGTRSFDQCDPVATEPDPKYRYDSLPWSP